MTAAVVGSHLLHAAKNFRASSHWWIGCITAKNSWFGTPLTMTSIFVFFRVVKELTGTQKGWVAPQTK